MIRLSSTSCGSSVQGHKLTGGSGTHRLTLYIAIPTTIFFICLCVVTYCLISRRTAHNRRASNVRHQRNYFSAVQQSQIKSSSAASSTSIGVCRNGMNGHGGGGGGGAGMNTSSGDSRLRPSPAGTTALGTTSLGYSSVNGCSNSMNTGNGPMGPQMSTPNYLHNPTGLQMVQGSGYPVLIQSQQPVTQFYSVPDSYGQNVSPITNIANNNNAGLMYPMANGHVINQTVSNLPPNSIFNSSPESSAAGINNTHTNNNTNNNGNIEPVEGRLMFRPQPQLANTNTGNTLRGYGYMPPPSGQSYISSSGINTSDYEMTITNTPASLMSYPNHGNA
ncbi:unnamed protein product [Trichobilharzia regenti]|nr:unnamed protein product [Trichobilharzia regenti]